MRAEILTLRAQLAMATTPQQPRRPRTVLPDPEKFAGSTYKFDTWLPSIRAKLRVDGEAIGDAVAQFYYVYLNLDSSVQSMVLPQLSQAEIDQLWDYNSILAQLSRVYDNPNKQQEAEDRLFQLKQGTDSLPAFTAKFERTLYEAGGQAWPDVNKITNFRNGLNSALRSRLAQQLNLPRSYPEFLRTVQQLSSKTAAPPYVSAPKIADRNDPMDVSELTIGAFTTSFPLPEPPISPKMPARSTTLELRDEYRRTGRCVRCGSKDHWIRNCSLAPHNALAGDKQVTITAVNDDDSGGSEDEYTESEVDAMLAERPDIDWRRYVTSGTWK